MLLFRALGKIILLIPPPTQLLVYSVTIARGNTVPGQKLIALYARVLIQSMASCLYFAKLSPGHRTRSAEYNKFEQKAVFRLPPRARTKMIP
jgi:hypothetical protein